MTRGDERRRAVAAFRRYARLGLPWRRLSPFAMLTVIEKSAGGRGRLDLLAVYDTLRLLRASGAGETADAVEAIYFSLATYRLHKNEISGRVSYFARQHYLDERTVYRRLSAARDLYAKLRSDMETRAYDD